MDINTNYCLMTIAELSAIKVTNQFAVATELLLLASAMKETQVDLLRSILDQLTNEYHSLSAFEVNGERTSIEMSSEVMKLEKGSYDPEIIRSKLIRRALLQRLYLTYLEVGGTHGSFPLMELSGVLEIDQSEMMRHVQYLQDENYLEYPYLDGGMCTTHLTNFGVKLCEEKSGLFEAFGSIDVRVSSQNEELPSMDHIVNGKASKETQGSTVEAFEIDTVWKTIEIEYGVSKRQFGIKMGFVAEKFKREIIFRDVAQAFYLARNNFNKPAVILAGGVIEELIRLYLEAKRVSAQRETFEKYIEACINNKLLKSAVTKLSDSVRDFRNLVHMEKEVSGKHSISRATALGAVSSIFTLINDF